MSDCIFCKIVAGEIPSHQVYSDELSLAFLDINPVKPGHVLLIPREHIPMMTDANDAMVAALFQRARELMKKMKSALKADYVMLYVVGIDVPHWHIHLLPRHHGDGLQGWPKGSYAPGEAEAIVAQVAQD